jgi:EAL domain-containing protein (putative c-di-GMP-specific phosphodiesterase class I)
MSDSMGLTTIAEGVETAAQEKELRRLGCTLAQGNLFGKPGPPSKIEELIADSDGAQLLETSDADRLMSRLRERT